MSGGNFEFVEGNYGEIQQVNYSREIKTKPESNKAIVNRYKDYLRELEALKNEALNSKYSKKQAESQIAQKSEAIARLEEKIKVLAKENVPSDYVDSRAIKLKKSMMENLTTKVGKLYTIGIDKKEEIFGESKQEEFVDALPENLVSTAASVETIDEPELDPDTIDRQAITESVEEAFEEAKNNEQEPVEEETQIELAPLSPVQAVESKDSPQEEIEEYSVSSHDDLTTNDVKEIINDKLNEIGEIPEIETEEKEEPETMRVSRNNGINAKLNRFDEEGNVKEYHEEPPTVEEEKNIQEQQENITSSPIHTIDPYDIDSINERTMYKYTPMTDEEVKQAQEKLGFDEPIRSREEQTPPKEETQDGMQEYVMTDSQEKDTPKITELSENQPISSFGSNRTTIDGYKALKETVLQWKEKQSQSKKDADQAIEEANAAKQKAREMREMLAESDNSVAESMALLETYKKALEEDYNKNTATLEAAKERAQRDIDFVSENERKISDNKQLVEEIHSLIGEKVEPETIKKM